MDGKTLRTLALMEEKGKKRLHSHSHNGGDTRYTTYGVEGYFGWMDGWMGGRSIGYFGWMGFYRFYTPRGWGVRERGCMYVVDVFLFSVMLPEPEHWAGDMKSVL